MDRKINVTLIFKNETDAEAKTESQLQAELAEWAADLLSKYAEGEERPDTKEKEQASSQLLIRE